MELQERIEAALRRIKDGHAPMRVPVDQTDVDIVLADCAARVRELETEKALSDLSAEHLRTRLTSCEAALEEALSVTASESS